MKRIYFDTLDSTNDYCKRNASLLPSFCVVYTTHQTKGKGRNQRSWVSEPFLNLSLSLFIKKPINHPEYLSILTALAVVSTLKALDIQPQIKWPNDILIEKKKVCGILLEALNQGKKTDYIIGVGININTTSFPDELKKKATSIAIFLNQTISIKKVLRIFLRNWKKLFATFEKKSDFYMQEYKKYSCVLHQKIQFEYNRQLCEGIVVDILKDGSLQIEMENKKITINYGEISLQNFY